MGVQGLRELRLHLDVAHLAGAIARFQILDLRLVGIERIVIHEHRVAFDRSRNIRAHPLRVGVHLHDLFPNRLCVVRKIDRVSVALGHLAVVESGEPRKRCQQWLRFDEELAVEVVKPADDFATQFQMRHLILAHRNELRVVNDDVGRLQQWIPEKTQRREILLGELFDLLFVGRDPFQPGNRNSHREQQKEFRVFGHQRLNEECRPFGIETRGEPVGRHVEGARHDLRGVGVIAGERMPVGDEIEAIVLILKGGPIIQRSDKVPEVQLSGRAHARNHTRLHSEC